MNKESWKAYAFFILLAEAVGILSGLLTRSGMANYDAVLKSPLTPPDLVFPIVWTILYALMGVGAARVWLSDDSPARSRGLTLFALQLAVNFFWSILFFNLQAYGLALAWLILLWVLILLMILSFRRTDRIAAWLQIPYLIWVTFAGYLNYTVWVLNG